MWQLQSTYQSIVFIPGSRVQGIAPGIGYCETSTSAGSEDLVSDGWK
jgi:hypothetical protein